LVVVHEVELGRVVAGFPPTPIVLDHLGVVSNRIAGTIDYW
jgi:hypothetical protein